MKKLKLLTEDFKVRRLDRVEVHSLLGYLLALAPWWRVPHLPRYSWGRYSYPKVYHRTPNPSHPGGAPSTWG